MESLFEVIRDPLWNNIRIDADALAVLDSSAVQRLRYIRQLGHAYLVYPGATHTRFEHALGTYHLTRRTLALLQERGQLRDSDNEDIKLVQLAALLHDIGHYPFSHALEEAGLPTHEKLAEFHLEQPDIQSVLENTGIADAAKRIANLIAGKSTSPLQGLISGSLDLDKIEYLTRDARMCGVPYGTVDVDRLLHSLTLIELENGERTVGVHEKGVSALESLLFARYQMYRNVYWHHAVRSATAMFKRLVREVMKSGRLDLESIDKSTDEVLMADLESLDQPPIAIRLRKRQLFKRAVDLPGSQLPTQAGSWIADDPNLTERAEDWLAARSGLKPSELLLDFPRKPAMLAANLPVQRRDGGVEPLNHGSGPWPLGIQQVSEQLNANARHLRIFAAKPVNIDEKMVLELLEGGADLLD